MLSPAAVSLSTINCTLDVLETWWRMTDIGPSAWIYIFSVWHLLLSSEVWSTGACSASPVFCSTFFSWCWAFYCSIHCQKWCDRVKNAATVIRQSLSYTTRITPLNAQKHSDPYFKLDNSWLFHLSKQRSRATINGFNYRHPGKSIEFWMR